MLTTSYFAMARYLPSPVSISSMKPSWYDGPEVRMLAPPFFIVEAYKSGYLSEANYIKDYTENVLKPLNQKDVYDYIVSAFGEDASLLCYEKAGEFCHRRIVAKWLEKGLGIDVPELVVTADMKKKYNQAKKSVIV